MKPPAHVSASTVRSAGAGARAGNGGEGVSRQVFSCLLAALATGISRPPNHATESIPLGYHSGWPVTGRQPRLPRQSLRHSSSHFVTTG